MNEFEEILAIKEERAKESKREGGEVGAKGFGKFSRPLDDTGVTRGKAAEKVNADVIVAAGLAVVTNTVGQDTRGVG